MSEITKNLPSNHLPAQSHERFLSEISKGRTFTVAEGRNLSRLPIPQIRKELTTKLLALEGRPLMRPECDACLKFLALTLPRAALSTQDAHDMMDVYFGLLRDAGVTGEMLTTACKAYVMRPTGGLAKFFPDPGQLAEMCAAEISQKKREIASLQSSLELLDSPPSAPDAPPVERSKLRSVGDSLKAFHGKQSGRAAENSPSVAEILASRPQAAADAALAMRAAQGGNDAAE